jgi:hypothetical protein
MATTTKTKNDTNATAEERQFLERYGERLSPSTHRAKWIHTPDERPDRKGQTLATRSPEVIRAWAEERGGRPAAATRGKDDGRPHVLRIRFTDGDGAGNGRGGNGDGVRGGGNGSGRDGDGAGKGRGRSNLEEIAWQEWLDTFQERDLVFIYQEQRRDGRQSTFFRLDNPRREDG